MAIMTNLPEEALQKDLDVLRRHDVVRAAIFGSFARGTSREDSDLDRCHVPGAASAPARANGHSMKDKGTRIFIEHILESINLIKGYTKDVSREDFLSSLQIQDAVIRRLEIIGEAVKNIPAEFDGWYERCTYS